MYFCIIVFKRGGIFVKYRIFGYLGMFVCLWDIFRVVFIYDFLLNINIGVWGKI